MLKESKKKNIGERIKRYRLATNMSQMALAEKIGISYQQLQKYEKGINNISVNRLQQISEALKVPISEFFKDRDYEKIAEEVGEYGLSREEQKILELFRRIDDGEIRRGLFLELKGIVRLIEKQKKHE
jgi:transcriptional regulator with XRE-family HTH domain